MFTNMMIGLVAGADNRRLQCDLDLFVDRLASGRASTATDQAGDSPDNRFAEWDMRKDDCACRRDLLAATLPREMFWLGDNSEK